MTLRSILSVLALAGVAHASDKKISEAEVPKPVLERAAKKYPTGKATAYELETEDGKTSYEVKLVDGKRKVELICAADGTVIAEEEVVALDEVPQAVRHALETHATYGSWTFRKAERVVQAENAKSPTYELKVSKGSSRAELVFNADGKLLKTEKE